MKKISITIDKQGSVTVKTEGFRGKSCHEATEQLEKALGSTTKDQKTNEFYLKEVVHVSSQR